MNMERNMEIPVIKLYLIHSESADTLRVVDSREHGRILFSWGVMYSLFDNVATMLPRTTPVCVRRSRLCPPLSTASAAPDCVRRSRLRPRSRLQGIIWLR